MILKKELKDFVVKENLQLDLEPKYSKQFPYAIYLMKKIGLETGQAMNIVQKRLRVTGEEIKLSGLKDKEALTYQYVSIKGKHPPEIKLKNLELTLKGYYNHPLSIGMHKSNTFELVIRDLTKEQINNLKDKTSNLIIPNYFGNQRFGSVRFFHDSDDFMIKHVIKGHYWDALKIYLTRFTPEDENKHVKKLIKQYWKDLKSCPSLPRGEYATLVDVLQNTRNPLVALKKIRNIKMQIYAYQSYLWNETLKEYIKQNSKFKPIDYICGQLYFPKEKIKNIPIPILNYRSKLPPELKEILIKIMKKEGIFQEDMRTKIFGKDFFSTSKRDAFVEVKDFKVLDEGKDFVKVKFTLPKGAYATIVAEGLVL